MSTPSVQMSARTWPIRSVQVQLGNSGPTSMIEPKLRAASGSQEDPVHRRAEQGAPRLTTEALAAVVTAFSISAEELLRQSPDLYALLLLQRLPQLEDLRKKANSEGESTNIFSRTSTTSPSQAKMERNHKMPWDPHRTRTWVPTLTQAHPRTWPTQFLYPSDLEGQYGVRSCQSLAGALKCAPHM